MIDDFRFGRIAVIGDLLLDQYVSGNVSRISPEAPVPVLLNNAIRRVPGGAANVAVNAAALGVEVRLVGLVGQDEAAQHLRAALSEWEGVCQAGIVSSPDWTTITKTRVVSGLQQIVRIDVEKVIPLPEDVQLSLIEAAQAAIAEVDVIVCSDYAKGVLNDVVLKAVISAGKARGIPVLVDPKRATLYAYAGATLVTPNRMEAEQATGLSARTNDGVLAVAKALSAQFGGDVLITRSEDGMTLWRRDGASTHVAARKSEVFDVSGAGDTVVATVASVLSAGQDLETAVVIATAAASISVGKLGTATVSREELSRELGQETPGNGALVTLSEAALIAENWRRHGARIVFTNGCFDLVHPGHVSLLQAAAKEGDKLIVALNTDRSVSALKGPDRPVQNEEARATVIGALRAVDLVLLFDEETPLEAIRAIRPDVLVKGSDYTEDQVIGGDIVKDYGGRVALVDLVEGHSTTRLVHKAHGKISG